jgi:hypothetical protein
MEAETAVVLTGRRGGLALSRRILGHGKTYSGKTWSGEPGHQNQKSGADWGKAIHFRLPDEPNVRLVTGFSMASAKLNPSIAVCRNEARVTLVPTARMTQGKRLKTLGFQAPFAMRRFLDSHTPKHYGPRGFLG